MQRAMMAAIGVVMLATPAFADVDLTARQTLRLSNQMDALINELPLATAEGCDQRRHMIGNTGGATGDWLTDADDATCNEWFERMAAVLAMWTGGTFAPADLVTAWCAAAAFVQSVKELNLNEEIAVREEYRQAQDDYLRKYKGWNDGFEHYVIWMTINTTVGFVTTSIHFPE